MVSVNFSKRSARGPPGPSNSEHLPARRWVCQKPHAVSTHFPQHRRHAWLVCPPNLTANWRRRTSKLFCRLLENKRKSSDYFDPSSSRGGETAAPEGVSYSDAAHLPRRDKKHGDLVYQKNNDNSPATELRDTEHCDLIKNSENQL